MAVRQSTQLIARPAQRLQPSPRPKCREQPAPRPAVEADDPSLEIADVVDRSVHFLVSRFTLGLSPAALLEAYFDWIIHLLAAPGKRSQLVHKALRKWLRFLHYSAAVASNPNCPECCIEPLPQDKRFRDEAWKSWPYNLISQAFLLQQQWWHNATVGVRGVTCQHEQQVEFATRQLLDMFSPSNFILTNPEVLHKTQADFGMNLMRGYWNFVEDWERASNGRPPVGLENFKVGENLATTAGEVIYRNELIELIQYEPRCKRVKAEPVLIVPAWIMKYYILDLSARNSLVKYLLDQGFTVFIISWKNPTSDDRNLSLEDYRKLGVEAALGVIETIVPQRKVHAVGYCLGGTLLAAVAAGLARDRRNHLATLTLLAAQVDFEEAGELTLFINEGQVSFLEDMMWEQGYLDARQMSGAFQLLRSNDLIWSRMVRDYLMGERQPLFDLMAWNADSTRMPYRMHSDYLRQLFLNNDLAEGRYLIDGRTAALTDIRAPVFAVATETDHVAPWRSVYKLNLLLDTDVTFLLTTGGHNAGIVSPPGNESRAYRVASRTERDGYLDPESWYKAVLPQQGSWWPEWVKWLAARSTGPTDAIAPGGGKLAPLCKAPGTYVLQT
ncbi:MAG: alpha/beta fold hydrolase [Hyphomicrobium sp.]|uniref:PHA/PHB synthase family protein n=1 Tax=Hyphomicrobium sp. TaxID=82 RepID=UPI00132B3F75|nr:alpha/beta fold hydrolase [Hyphomicrobium sp.]KAB2942358.1 MAG: alpha/beta fold hydrolase [Hyphomicrobium sp.]MBZ0212128.1 alpha/beta fold hydrolase [Hyphomicrobium sp.]